MARVRVGQRLSLLSLICLSSLMAPSAGWSRSPQKILILDPQSAFVSPEQLSELGTLLRQFAKTHPNLRPIRNTDLAQLRKKAKCLGTDNRCLKALGKAALAKRVLFSQIQKLPGRYMFVVSLLDTRSGKQVKRARAKTENLLPALRLAAKNTFDSMFGQVLPILLTVRANTPQARVLLDGKPIGQTPLKTKRNLVEGTHRIKLIHPQYHESVRTVRIKPKQTKMRLSFKLKKRTIQSLQIAKVPTTKTPEAQTKTKQPKTTAIPIIVKVDPDKKQPEPKPVSATKVDPDKKQTDQKTVSGAKKDEKLTAIKQPKPADQTTSSKPKKTPVHEKPASQSVPPAQDKPEKKASAAAEKTIQSREIDKSMKQPKPSKPKQAQQAKKKTSTPRFATPTEQKVTPATFTWSYLSEKWWFWTAIGSAVLVGAVTGTVIGIASDDSSYPSGSGRLVIGF